MRLFRFKWLRRLVRRHTSPIEETSAEKWERRLSAGYMFFAANAFIIVCYMAYKAKSDDTAYYGFRFKENEDASKPSGVKWAKLLGIQDARVVRLKGLRKVDEYEIINQEKVVTKSESEQ